MMDSGNIPLTSIFNSFGQIAQRSGGKRNGSDYSVQRRNREHGGKPSGVRNQVITTNSRNNDRELAKFGNNRVGRKGKPRCDHCRKWKRKVSQALTQK